MDAAIDRIEAYAQRKGGENPEVRDAVERVRNARGQDELHVRLFRTEALADLLDAVEEAEGREPVEPLEVKKVPELRQIANEQGVEGSVSEMNKGQLIDAINSKRQDDKCSEDQDEGEDNV